VGSLLSEKRSLYEVRALYRPLSEKGECGRLRSNGGKSRRHDRTLYISFLIIIRRSERDKDRETTLIRIDIVRFGL
jgi:hypothetical protein